MVEIKTAADGMIELLMQQEDRKLPLKVLSDELGEEVHTLESWAGLMSEYLGVEYPANMLSKPYVQLINEIPIQKPSRPPKGEVLSSYNISADNVSADISIIKSSGALAFAYYVDMPHIGVGTTLVLEGLSDQLTKKVPITVEDLSDQRRMAKLRDVFSNEAETLVAKEFAKDIEKNPGLRDVLAGTLLHSCYGLGIIELLMRDPMLEEICVNNSNAPIAAYHVNYGWLKSNISIPSEKEIFNLSSQIARKSGTNVTNLTPLMDAHLVSGDRANATLFPISSFGNTISIRKFARVPWTLISFLKKEHNTLSLDIAALLWLCMQYELNVLVTGGTASGKTSMLNAICSMIPSNQRIISIEETRELYLPEYLHWNWIPLTTRNPNPEGKGEVKMLDLAVNSLRMRPDRVIMGEVRRREEAEVLFEAMHTGHSVYSTVHADTSRHLVRRMTKPPFNLPQEDVEAIDLILVQFRDRKTGARRTLEVAEVMQSAGEDRVELNYLYRWNPRKDTFDAMHPSKRIFEKLNLYTGMTPAEISKDLAEKKEILSLMLANDITDINATGEIMGEYYRDREAVLERIRSARPKQAKGSKSVAKAHK